MNHLFVIFILLLSACNHPHTVDKNYVSIFSRDQGDPSQRFPLYRIELPKGWTIETNHTSVSDTKLPLIECMYTDNTNTIRLTIHNFPYTSLNQRVPLEAQLNRWKQQFELLDSASVTQQSFAGFMGFHLYAEGVIKEENTCVSAWTLQLGPEHQKSLAKNTERNMQIRSDVTIKAIGSKELMERKQSEIYALARSFELLDPLPNP